MPTNAPTFHELTPARTTDYLRFFDTRAFTDNPRWAGCYCYFPLHDPAQTDWAARTGTENRVAIVDCIAKGHARGVLAYDGADVVGWCNAGPWSLYPMLHDVPEADAETLGVIFCFIVAPAWRGRKVATGLLAAACDALRRQGMRAVQAKPLRSSTDAAANHFGPLSMYLAAGFEIVRAGSDGDVFVRRALA